MSSKLRDALEEAHALLEKIHSAYSDRQGDISMYPLRKVIKIVNEALAEPLRNCDVGTAEEQEQRFIALCNKQHDDCFMCPVQNDMKSQCDCKFVWSQMPYEKEGEQ